MNDEISFTTFVEFLIFLMILGMLWTVANSQFKQYKEREAIEQLKSEIIEEKIITIPANII